MVGLEIKYSLEGEPGFGHITQVVVAKTYCIADLGRRPGIGLQYLLQILQALLVVAIAVLYEGLKPEVEGLLPTTTGGVTLE
jgi:hypothetical protein